MLARLGVGVDVGLCIIEILRSYDSSTLTAGKVLCYRDASHWKRRIWSLEE